MADVPGDLPLPAVQQGPIERIDCMSGKEALHARIAVEAQGGQVLSFAYYSKWKPRTCSLDFERNGDGAKWRLTADGATRVSTPDGRFLIRTRADAYVFEFERVQRQKFCGMPGEINGTMTVKRGPGKPQCSAVGVLDTNDEYLDELYGAKQLRQPVFGRHTPQSDISSARITAHPSKNGGFSAPATLPFR